MASQVFKPVRSAIKYYKMESLNEIITNWYPVHFLISAGIAVLVWAWVSKRKARLDIDNAAKLILGCRHRKGEISKEQYERRRI
jgi:uncharacterized membrane protein